MTERFSKAYDALVQAFFEGTLAKGNCNACAVGNIINAAQGGVIQKNLLGRFSSAPSANWWADLFVSNYENKPQTQHRNADGEWHNVFFAERIYELTGYTASEMSLIEGAFEANAKIPEVEYHMHDDVEVLEDQYKGLSAVVDVMLLMDGEEPSAHPEYNAKFREHKKLQNG